MNIVKRFLNETRTDVSSVSPAAALPATYIIAPGTYTFGGENYDCSQEGLHVFFDPLGQTQRRVVYSSDVDALMSGMSWCAVSGRADEGLTAAQKTTKAMTAKLRMRCGETIEWAKYVCDALNIESRVVRALTGETPTNFADGHVMIEAKVNGQWKLFDVDNGYTYQETGGGQMLKDVLPVLPTTVLTSIAKDGYSVEPWVSGEFDTTAWIEIGKLTDAEKREWVDRVLQIPGIDHADGKTYFYLPTGMESRSSYVTGLSATYVVVDQATWLGMFYP